MRDDREKRRENSLQALHRILPSNSQYWEIPSTAGEKFIDKHFCEDFYNNRKIDTF